MTASSSAGWQAELEELAHRKHIARQRGSADRSARQHAGGWLTVRERIEQIIDPRDTRPLLCEFANMAAPLRTPGQSLFTMRP